VPIVHAVVENTILFAIDQKPKSGRPLRRLLNIAADPRVTVLFDHRTADWGELWWVRADGTATIRDERPDVADVLEARHPRYRSEPPPGPWVVIEVERWSGWTARSVPR
jgi:PPOX class probable F420-dependent enzyme